MLQAVTGVPHGAPVFAVIKKCVLYAEGLCGYNKDEK